MATATAIANQFPAAGVARVRAAAPRPSKRETLRAEIAEYANLPFDFDGEDGNAPPQREVDNALSFIDFIPEAGLDSLQSGANGGGEVIFDWETPQHSLVVSFMDGGISFWGELPNGGGELAGSGKHNKKTIPQKLRRLLDANFPA